MGDEQQTGRHQPDLYAPDSSSAGLLRAPQRCYDSIQTYSQTLHYELSFT